MDNCLQVNPGTMPYVTDIVSASDKIALRNSIGYQGALLSTVLLSSIRFTDIYVSRLVGSEGKYEVLDPDLPGETLSPSIPVNQGPTASQKY